jgi:hypothetical protein
MSKGADTAGVGRWRQSIRDGALGLLFSVGCGLFGFLFAGAGHGTDFFGRCIWSPHGFGILIWPCIGLMLPYANSRRAALAILLLLCANYVGIVFEWILEEDRYYVFHVFKAVPLFVSLLILSYVTVQVAILWKVINALAGRRPK